MTNYIGSLDDEKKLYQVLKKLGSLTESCSYNLSSELGLHHLHSKQAEYLKIIDTHPLLTSSALAEILKITKPSVTEIVNKLVGSGLVYKQQCSKDGRVFYIVLTDKGKKASSIHDLRDKKLAGNLCKNLSSAEIEALTRLIKKATE
ncbi:MAG: MarR family transcriptional regulator [Spirochaetales bacterium]|jgi:DNA-binding MarR family transcriptional regulator|nr:MarR family transcriptional regulator [Spirochaetales bacterium]